MEKTKKGLSVVFPEKHVYFYILSGSISDLSKIDFSPFHVQCHYYESYELDDFWKKVSFDQATLDRIRHEFWNYYETLQQREKLYVLVPQKSIKDYREDYFFHCRNVLLLLFPSVLGFKHMLTFEIVDDEHLRYIYSRDYDFRYSTTGDYDEEFLYFHDDYLPQINSFIALYAKSIESINYLKIAMNTYISSFQEKNPVMAFLSLCMTLESTINSESETTYRICRNVSLLISKDKEEADIVFKNIKVLYSLRSQIIHGSDYKFEKVLEWLPYLRGVASRVLINIVLLNIQDIHELNKEFTFMGFEKLNTLIPESNEKSFLDFHIEIDLFKQLR